VIMLVKDGDRVLLGRQKIWPAGLYSTLAGFVEPGETIEHAVAREVYEESGIIVKDIIYQHSQPWPFPSSLMLGFTAEACTKKINLMMLNLKMLNGLQEVRCLILKSRKSSCLGKYLFPEGLLMIGYTRIN
tara:strand:+ start:67 stop:459 length:393 start_codon:yes stop_codon:yes gene_type:complete